MHSNKLNDWLQIVGLFGVIGSLIFVGIQLKQTQAIALSETYMNRSTAVADMNVGQCPVLNFFLVCLRCT